MKKSEKLAQYHKACPYSVSVHISTALAYQSACAYSAFQEKLGLGYGCHKKLDINVQSAPFDPLLNSIYFFT
jgi:hypothetical protein